MSDGHLRRRRALPDRRLRPEPRRPARLGDGAVRGRQAARRAIRIFGQAYLASFHSAGVIRDDDYRAGRIGFYGTYDPLAGRGRVSATRWPSTSRTRAGTSLPTTWSSASCGRCGCARTSPASSSTCRTPLQPPHGQRGDLIDLNIMEGTVGAARPRAPLRHGATPAARDRDRLLRARRLRLGSATAHRSGDRPPVPHRHQPRLQPRRLGLYVDANLRPLRWLSLRGGVRGDVFTFDVHDNCAVQSIAHPNTNEPLFGAELLQRGEPRRLPRARSARLDLVGRLHAARVDHRRALVGGEPHRVGGAGRALDRPHATSRRTPRRPSPASLPTREASRSPGRSRTPSICRRARSSSTPRSITISSSRRRSGATCSPARRRAWARRRRCG